MNALKDLLGSSPYVFLMLTVLFMGGCAAMTGQALARTWRPGWQVLPYGLLLGLGDRFLAFAMFKGQLLSGGAYLRDALLLVVIAALVYRTTRARQMVTQYPWLYRRNGPFGWKEIEQ